MANSTVMSTSSALLLKTVEPTRRMVGGAFGWATHRFPIRGGITPLEALRISVSEEVSRPSYFARLHKPGAADGR